jgi:hypothetical protein
MLGYVKKAFGLIMLKTDTYNEVIGDEDALLPSLLVLILPPFLIGLVLALIIGSVDVGAVEPGMEEAYKYIVIGKGLGFSLPFFLPFLFLMSFAISVGMYHLAAKLLKGEGEFFDLLQVMGLPSVLMYIPLVGIWYLVVQVVAIKNVYGFSTGKAAIVWIGAGILATIISSVLFGILAGLLAAMAG